MRELEWIRNRLADRRIPAVAKATGLSEPTIRAIRDNKNADPKLSTLQALHDYLVGDGE